MGCGALGYGGGYCFSILQDSSVNNVSTDQLWGEPFIIVGVGGGGQAKLKKKYCSKKIFLKKK